MSVRALSITLSGKQNFKAGSQSAGADVRSRSFAKRFLRIPPFPGACLDSFESAPSSSVPSAELAGLIRKLRVGGAFWARQPELPPSYVLYQTGTDLRITPNIDEGVQWPHAAPKVEDATLVVTGECDPWHMLSGAAYLVTTDEDSDLAIVAALLGVPVYLSNCATGAIIRVRATAASLLHDTLGRDYRNPFTYEPMSARDVIELCGFWRQLIDANRDIVGAAGFAFWKQDHVAPLLWRGSEPVRFLRAIPTVSPGDRVAVWRSRLSSEALAVLDRDRVPVVEVEDGFLRSKGLGANCVPPLSITVDRRGAYFDPRQPSELELLLQNGQFDAALLARARNLRQSIVEAGLGKYERGAGVFERPQGERRHILVPGQVEDDRAVEIGGCGLVSNLELLRRVRAEAPDAYIIYKPHPDVVAGHRRGAVCHTDCFKHADQVVVDTPISSLMAAVDEVHVNTSLTGFEALLRGTAVTTYGVPFYAGWGLTKDLGPVPARRSSKRTLDELVAATLLIYPRYLDPISGLPCPAEVVVDRLTRDGVDNPGLVVRMRRLQGKLLGRFRSLVR